MEVSQAKDESRQIYNYLNLAHDAPPLVDTQKI
jgi:hypothetical protein